MVSDKFSQMSLKMAIKQLAHLGCRDIVHERRSSSILCTFEGRKIVADARDLLRDKMSKINFEKVAAKVRSDGEQCAASDVERLYNSLDADNKAAAVIEQWLIDTLINTQPQA